MSPTKYPPARRCADIAARFAVQDGALLGRLAGLGHTADTPRHARMLADVLDHNQLMLDACNATHSVPDSVTEPAYHAHLVTVVEILDRIVRAWEPLPEPWKTGRHERTATA